MRRNLIRHDDPVDVTVLVAVLDPRIAENDWRRQAACQDTYADLWFPEQGDSIREAKEICEFCPVKAPCGQYALANDVGFGVWGGMSAKERKAMRRTSSALSDAA